MFYKLVEHSFSEMFGCKPTVINDFNDIMQVKFDFLKINTKNFYQILSDLRKKYENLNLKIVVLLTDARILQVIVGTEEAVSRNNFEKNKTDFIIEIC